MRTLLSLVRPNIANLVPYASARTEYSGESTVLLDANENPFGPYNRYPDPLQKRLKSELAAIKHIRAEQIFVGNGSDEVIDLCFRIFCRPGIDKAITFSPTYGMYDVAAAVNDTTLIKIPLDEQFQPDAAQLSGYLSDPAVKLLLLCSPNNPTGNTLQGIAAMLETFTGIVLVDEAYIDFASTSSFLDTLDRYPHLIVAQTLSKAYGMAAVRIGLAFASVPVIDLFNKVKPPYNVSSLNQEAALSALAAQEALRQQRELLIAERRRVSDLLQQIPLVVHVYPSEANFLLVRVTDADGVYAALLQQGIICRNRNSAVHNCLRITIGTPEENNQLIQALLNLSEQ